VVLIAVVNEGQEGVASPGFSLHSTDIVLDLGTHYLSRNLDQETAKGLFRSSSKAATCCYQSNHSKVDIIPLSALSKSTTSELAAYLHTRLFNAECQAGKL